MNVIFLPTSFFSLPSRPVCPFVPSRLPLRPVICPSAGRLPGETAAAGSRYGPSLFRLRSVLSLSSSPGARFRRRVATATRRDWSCDERRPATPVRRRARVGDASPETSDGRRPQRRRTCTRAIPAGSEQLARPSARPRCIARLQSRQTAAGATAAGGPTVSLPP